MKPRSMLAFTGLTLGLALLTGCSSFPHRTTDESESVRDRLMGAEWVIEDIAGRAPLETSRPTLQFLPEGRLAGSGSCNRYAGQWSLAGETLEVGPLVSTRRACLPELMAQEDRFLRLLESARALELDAQGTLEIRADDGETLRAIPAGE